MFILKQWLVLTQIIEIYAISNFFLRANVYIMQNKARDSVTLMHFSASFVEVEPIIYMVEYFPALTCLKKKYNVGRKVVHKASNERQYHIIKKYQENEHEKIEGGEKLMIHILIRVAR